MAEDSEIKKLVKEHAYDKLVKRHLKGEVVVFEIISLLEGENRFMRWDAALALSEIGGKDPEAIKGATPKLISLLDDKDDYIRWNAATALGKISEKDPEAVRGAIPRLISLLDDKDDHIRQEAISALGMIGKKDAEAIKAATPKLIRLLEDEHEYVRDNVAEALGRIGQKDPEAVRGAIPKLISLLDDVHKFVRGYAAWALGRIGAEEALKKLRELLNDSTEVYIYGEGKMIVGKVAREAIERIEAKPEIVLELSSTDFEPNAWEEMEIRLKNIGTAHAEAIRIDFSQEVEVTQLRLPERLQVGEERAATLLLMPLLNEGRLPMTVSLSFRDMIGRNYTAEKVFRLNVGVDARVEEVKEKVPLPPPRLLYFPTQLLPLYSSPTSLGKGGFARVFRVKRRNDGQEVAVKVPLNLDPATGKSFIREITSWQRLKHMNIVRLNDLNILPIPYLEMELCQKSLHELPKPLVAESAASMMFHVAEGLKYAHSQGIIHRDLKPQNILLLGEVPKISDWGLSKVVAETKSTAVQSFSPLYAAPEQLSPQKFGKPDHRTDIYQLGTIFYELATGELPFKGDNITELMGQIINTEPTKTSVRNPATNEVEPIIMKCLQKEMKERYQSVAEMQRDLAEYLKVEFRDSLSKSHGDMKRSGYYCAELCLVHLRVGDLGEALKYAVDLNNYASEEVKTDLAAIISELEFRSKEDMVISEEFLERAAIVLHQARMGR